MLKVNEIFGPTIQGEGKTAGQPCNFLRLAMCNLHCQWCDTPYTWNWKGTDFKHPDKYDKNKEIHLMTDEQIIEKINALKGPKSLVISGGEPLIQHKQLTSLCHKLKSSGSYWIEIETNGTIYPNQELLNCVDMINCSPKLSNSGDPQSLREKPNALIKLSTHRRVNFKFVISSPRDINEVLLLVEKYNMKEVRLMPEARTKKELKRRTEWLKPFCEMNGFIFSSRLSVSELGGVRGV